MRKIEKYLEQGEVVKAKALLAEHYNKEHKAEWTANKQAEYDTLFKTVLVEVAEEVDEDGNVTKEANSYYDYQEDCPIFTEWLNETRLVSEAVEATYDEEGNVVTPYQPEVTELVRPYESMDNAELESKVEAYLQPYYDKVAKAEKAEKIASLYVTVNGIEYDAHEEAISNMNSTINTANAQLAKLLASGTDYATAYDAIFKTTIQWKGYDNLSYNVQIENIAEALELAIRARASVYGVVR